jgi:radical SAM modification target selenobiotic family peptide
MEGGENMDKDQIKSLVAGLGIASLVAGVSIAAPTHAAQSGWGGGAGAGSTPKEKSAVLKNATSAKAGKKAKKDVKKDAAKDQKAGEKPK